MTSILLTIVGIVYVASASSYWSSVHYPDSTPFWVKQLIFAGLGYGLFQVITKTCKIKRSWIPILYGIGILALLTVWIPGFGVVRNGARGWVSLAGFYFQPAELTKITTLLYLAWLLYEKKSFVTKLIIVIVPCILLMLQPDFGSTFLILVVACSLLFIGGLSIKLLMIGFGVGIISLAGLILSAPYRLKRITAFLDPWEDPLGAGFQAIQSFLAIGPAGFTGWGFTESRQKLLYLPEPQNDFIFALIVEENGFLMGAVVCLLYAAWGLAAFQLAHHLKWSAYSLAIVALSSLVLFQSFVNLGVVTGLLPVTGVTLPFISYGGSSLVLCWMITALICALYRSGKEAEEWKK